RGAWSCAVAPPSSLPPLPARRPSVGILLVRGAPCVPAHRRLLRLKHHLHASVRLFVENIIAVSSLAQRQAMSDDVIHFELSFLDKRKQLIDVVVHRRLPRENRDRFVDHLS